MSFVKNPRRYRLSYLTIRNVHFLHNQLIRHETTQSVNKSNHDRIMYKEDNDFNTTQPIKITSTTKTTKAGQMQSICRTPSTNVRKGNIGLKTKSRVKR